MAVSILTKDHLLRVPHAGQLSARSMEDISFRVRVNFLFVLSNPCGRLVSSSPSTQHLLTDQQGCWS